jgi:hypothetical protein
MNRLEFGPRQSGRTTRLINEIVRDMKLHSRPIMLVTASYQYGFELRRVIASMNGQQSRVHVHCLRSLDTLRGRNPLDIYFDHTVYEQASAKQLAHIYQIEDQLKALIWGAP